MDKILTITILEILNQAGYTSANPKAVELLKLTFIQKMQKTMQNICSLTKHSQKPNTTVLEIYKHFKLASIHVKKENIKSFPVLNFEKEDFSIEKPFENAIASSIEKYIHIYEFMPDFPPAHTFRRTFIKEQKKEDKAEKLKKKLEQNRVSLENLIVLLKESNNMPDHVNYLNSL